jgi:long-chain acyl-CoA synthetase
VAETLPALFEAGVERHADRPAQAFKGGVHDRALVPDALAAAPEGAFASLSYAEVRAVVRRLAVGFRESGVSPGDRVALFARTRMEWAQCDLALLAAGAVVVPVYPDTSTDRIARLLADADVSAAVADDAAALDSLRAAGRRADAGLAPIVAMDDVAGVTGLDAVYRRGNAQYDPATDGAWVAERAPSELATLVYTSGTTGEPRGVPLTHRNLVANVEQCYRRFGPDGDGPAVDAEARAVSVLPLSHLFERLAGHFLLFAAGTQVAYAERPATLREDFALVEPTVGTSVPRMYRRLHDAVRDGVRASAVPDRAFEWASGVLRRLATEADPGTRTRLAAPVADRLVGRRLRAALGGNVEFLISGGARLPPDLGALFAGAGVPVLEGYGLTEAGPVVAATPPASPAVGTVGPPVAGCAVRLDESVTAPDAAADPDGSVGELLIRGPNVFSGYRDPDRPGESFDGEWFRTGDVVEMRPDGRLRVVARATEMLTLSTGKNVAPEPIEDDLVVCSPVVAQCLLVGDGRPFVGALIVPEFDALREWADGADVALPEGRAAVCDDERVRERIRPDVEAVNADRERHEAIKRFRVVPEPFTEANDLRTATGKKRRAAIVARHAGAVEALYDDVG